MLVTHETAVADKAALNGLLDHLVAELDACGFLRNAPKRPGMVRNIHHLFQRGEVTAQEIRTLHGNRVRAVARTHAPGAAGVAGQPATAQL